MIKYCRVERKVEKSRGKPLFLTLCGVTAGFAALCFAAAPALASDIETVVVTAQKRAESLQKVPVSVSVVSDETLKKFNMTEMTDLQYLVPSVTLTNSAGPRSFGFFIRGIGTSSFSSESIESSTAVVVDGVVLGQAGAALSDLPDIDHVEVLRGPQGTLFGTSASAGVINITTRKPSDVFEVRAGVTYAIPENSRQFRGSISGPITDTLKYYLSGRMNKHDGIIKNVFDGRKLNNRNDYGFRGKLEFTPNSKLDVMLIADYYNRDVACCEWTISSVGIGGPATALEQISLGAGIVPSLNNRKQNIDGPVFAKEKSYGASAQIDYDVGGGYNVTSITAYRRWFSLDGLDSDSSPIDFLNRNFANFKQSQVSQELRVTSPLGGLVDFVAGGYFYEQHVSSESTQIFPTLPIPFFNRIVDNTAQNRNLSVFGQANVNFSKTFRMILGARYVNQREEAIKDRRDPVFNLTSHANESRTDNAFIWRAGLQYDLTPSNMIYGTVTKGFKGGGFNTNISIPTLPAVLPEKPLAFEIGTRNQWPKARILLNISAYYDHAIGYQVSALVPGVNGAPGISTILNGDAYTKGVEFNADWQPIAHLDWLLTASGGYNDAHWGNYKNAPCHSYQTVAQGCVAGAQDVSSQQLPYAPKWTFNLATSYTTAIPGKAWQAGFNVGVNYHSAQGISFPQNPDTIQKGFALVNASISLSDDNNIWKLRLFARNLTNHNYVAGFFGTPFGSGYSQFPLYNARRSVGISLDVRY